MDEPAAVSHLALVIEASVVVTPHGHGQKGKQRRALPLHLKAAPEERESLALFEFWPFQSCDMW